ncbi:hypothetical protein, partial [Klebsiella pneumoniae]|uniref:hypothetical protein n=1 Tax=Klebsiella pneumoniae TaxID=573 RepID=UPI00210A6C8E
SSRHALIALSRTLPAMNRPNNSHSRVRGRQLGRASLAADAIGASEGRNLRSWRSILRNRLLLP